MLIVIDTGATPRTVSIGETPIVTTETEQRLAQVQPDPVYETVQIEGSDPPEYENRLAEIQPDPVYETYEVEITESDEAFIARMVAKHVPADTSYMIDPVLPPGVPPERWAVDWQTGEITVAAPTVAMLKAYASDKRWQVEVGGTVAGGITIPTDDRAKTMIGRAARTGSAVPSTPFIVGGVNYGVLTKAQFEALDAAVDVHIAATFETLAAVIAAIDAGTITTTAELDEAFA